MRWLLLPLLVFAATDDGQLRWDFECHAVGKEPEGFYFDTTNNRTDAEWRIIDDGGNRVLAQLNRKDDERRFALGVVEDQRIKHIRLSTRIKAVAGDEERGGGLVWRYQNSENYLAVRLDVEDDRVDLFRFVRGNRIRFDGVREVGLEMNRWYTLRVEHRGSEIKVYLDGEMIRDSRDRHFRQEGRFGVWVHADSATYFDDLVAVELDDGDDD